MTEIAEVGWPGNGLYLHDVHERLLSIFGARRIGTEPHVVQQFRDPFSNSESVPFIMASHSVLFVCLGNICRSPIAEAIFRKLLADKNCVGQWKVRLCVVPQ